MMAGVTGVVLAESAAVLYTLQGNGIYTLLPSGECR